MTLQLATEKCDDGSTGHLQLQLGLIPEWPFLKKTASTGLEAQMAQGQVRLCHPGQSWASQVNSQDGLYLSVGRQLPHEVVVKSP